MGTEAEKGHISAVYQKEWIVDENEVVYPLLSSDSTQEDRKSSQND